MMNGHLKTKTLAQIVSAYNEAAIVLEKYQLDFCCRGKRTLEAACHEKKLEAGKIIAELESVIQQKENATLDFEEMPVAQLSDYVLERHHRYVREKLPLIFAYLQKVAGKHGSRHPELHMLLEKFTLLKEELELHMQKEELILFPRIKELEKTFGQGFYRMNEDPAFMSLPLQVMETEHEHAGNLLSEMRSLSANFEAPVDACTTYRLSFDMLKDFETDLHQHIHLENNILFPKAIEIINNLNKAELN